MKGKRALMVFLGAVAAFAVFSGGYLLGRSHRGAVVSVGTPIAARELDTDGDDRMDLNSADAEMLMTLPGIGEKTAAAIIAYREEWGAFGSVWELEAVPGIGKGTLNAVSPYLTVK